MTFTIDHALFAWPDHDEVRAACETVGLDETEQRPLAFLLSTGDFEAAAERFTLADAGEWADRRVAWFDADPFRAGLGVLEAS